MTRWQTLLAPSSDRAANRSQRRLLVSRRWQSARPLACGVALLATLIVGSATRVTAQSPEPEPEAIDAPVSCLDCHSSADDPSAPMSPFALMATSVHGGLDCTSCHESISLEDLIASSPKPHGQFIKAVDCGECHDDEAEIYRQHGRLEIGKNADLPTCASCHGTHGILPSSDRRSSVHAGNLPDTCRSCHTNVDLVERHESLRDQPIKLYESSVHGKATRRGVYAAALCNDCHSAEGPDGVPTAHRILSAADPESTTYHFSIPDTCGQCHKSVTRDYWEGIHGQLVRRGSVDSPVCTHCHGEHGIMAPDDPRSPVSVVHVAEQTCARCHESAILNQKYGLPGGRSASYIDNYHGLKSTTGDATVANCASCHGAHRILPSTDPTSSIHADNLRQTCGECHPKISSELAQSRIHQTTMGVQDGWPGFFRKLYLVLIAVTIGGMVVHNGADWLRHIKHTNALPFVQRLSVSEVAQHWVLMLSFGVLVASGFSLRFSEAAWVRLLFGWEGGFEARGIIHRVAAVVMTIGSAWHVLYLFSARGRQWFKDMLAARSDLACLKHNMEYLAGLRSDEPRYKRFSYMEKVEYWALAWGTAVMIGTGFLLWFDNAFIARWGLPKVVLDVGLVIHYYEAWLAFLAILVWHVYGTVFKPAVYPMNTAWLSGRMPKPMYEREHADGPRLTARTRTVRYEEEKGPEPPPRIDPTISPGGGLSEEAAERKPAEESEPPEPGGGS